MDADAIAAAIERFGARSFEHGLERGFTEYQPRPDFSRLEVARDMREEAKTILEGLVADAQDAHDNLVIAVKLALDMINHLSYVVNCEWSGNFEQGPAAFYHCHEGELGNIATYDFLTAFVEADKRTPEEIEALMAAERQPDSLGEEVRKMFVDGVPEGYVIEQVTAGKSLVTRPDGSSFTIEVD